MCSTVRAAVHPVGAAIVDQRGSSSSTAARGAKAAAAAVTSAGDRSSTLPLSRMPARPAAAVTAGSSSAGHGRHGDGRRPQSRQALVLRNVGRTPGSLSGVYSVVAQPEQALDRPALQGRDPCQGIRQLSLDRLQALLGRRSNVGRGGGRSLLPAACLLLRWRRGIPSLRCVPRAGPPPTGHCHTRRLSMSGGVGLEYAPRKAAPVGGH